MDLIYVVRAKSSVVRGFLMYYIRQLEPCNVLVRRTIAQCHALQEGLNLVTLRVPLKMSLESKTLHRLHDVAFKV